MADILSSVSVVLGAEISGFRSGMAQAKRELSGLVKFSEGLQNIGSTLTQSISAPLALLGGVSLKAAADMDALKRGFEATYKGAEPLNQALAETAELAKLPGLGLREALVGATNLQAAGFSAAQARKELAAFGNAIATVGKGKADLDRVSLALTQINNTPFVQGQDLNQLRQTLPQIGEAMKKAFGVSNAEGLKQIGVTSQQFIARITDEFAKLPKVTGGLQNTFENASDAITTALSGLGEEINKAFDVEGVVDALSNQLKGAIAAFQELSPASKQLILDLAAIAATTGPAAVALGALGAGLPALKAGFAAVKSGVALLGDGLAALAGPTGLVIVGLAALAAGVYYLSTANARALRSYQDLAKEADQLSASTQPLLARYQELSEKTNRTETEQRELTSVIQQLAQAVPGAVTEIDQYGQVVGISASQVRELTEALQQKKAALASQNLGAATAELERLRRTYQNLQQQVQQFNQKGFLEVAESDQSGDALVYRYRAGSAAVLQLRTDLATANVEFQKQVQLVAQLTGDSQGLGALRATIAPLGDLYYKLGGGQNEAATSMGVLSAAAKEMAKAYAEVQKSFRSIGNESLALGEQFKYLEARQAADQSGIKRLIDAGYSPFSSAVQNLVGDLRRLNTILGDNEQLSLRVAKGLENVGKPKDFQLELPKEMALPALVLPDYGAIFGAAASQLAAGNGQLQQGFEAVKQSQLDFNTGMEQLTDQLGEAIGPALANIAGLFGDAFGSIVAGTASAGDAFRTLFGGILESIGGFMKEFGERLIVLGIGKIGLDTLFDGPQGGPLAIAAGIGLVALAGAASSLGKSMSSASKSIGSGGGSSSYSSPATPNYGQGSSAQTIRVVAEFKLRGKDLVAVGRSQDYRSDVTD